MISNYRYIVLCVLLLLVGGGWISLAKSGAELTEAWTQHVASARAARELGVTATVVEEYRAALAIRSELGVAKELTEYLDELGGDEEYLGWLDELRAAFPDEAYSYEKMVGALVEKGEIGEAYERLEAATRSGVTSPALDDLRRSVSFAHEVSSPAFVDVRGYVGDHAQVYDGEYWSVLDAVGGRFGGRYDEVSDVGSGVLAVRDQDGPRFVDEHGDTVLVAKRAPYVSYGRMSANGIFPARGEGGRVVFVDRTFAPLHGGTSYADGTAYAYGIAGVQLDDGTWSVIDEAGATIAAGFTDLVREADDTIAGAERFFGQRDGKYAIYGLDGARVGDLSFDDARLFVDGAAAVRSGALWGFVSPDGTWVHEPKWQDALSYANGVAAVAADGLWGYVDASGVLVIDAQFGGATNMSSAGRALVVPNDAEAGPSADGEQAPRWALLKLKRFER